MKNMNTLLTFAIIASFFLSCEFLTPSEDPYEKIVFLGKIISTPKYATFSAPIPIDQQPPQNKINRVHIDFENQRIHFYGNTTTDAKCYFDRQMSEAELASLEKPIRELEFCELQTNQNLACPALFMPTDSISIYDYQKLHHVDEYSSYCSANNPQLCNGADVKPLFATIKSLALQDIDHCQ